MRYFLRSTTLQSKLLDARPLLELGTKNGVHKLSGGDLLGWGWMGKRGGREVEEGKKESAFVIIGT